MKFNDLHNSSELNLRHGFQAHWQTIQPFIARGFRAIFSSIQGEFNTFISFDGYPIGYRKWVHKTPAIQDKVLYILSHGLEGSAESGYIQETAKALHHKGYDVWAWYMRGCSTVNSGPILYNSGFTADLRTLAENAKKLGYKKIYLVGFSVGGNITLKLLGEGIQGISKAVCFSVPLHLEDVAIHLSKTFYGIYMKRFLKSLKEKIRLSKTRYPESKFNMPLLDQCHDFEAFDEHFTAPMHGYSSAHDYYTQSSSLFILSKIETPCLVVNAQNDPFLTLSCFPNPNSLPNLCIEYPLNGGHCGFEIKGKSMVKMTLDFIAQ
jgi:uncharacterized protein